MPKSSLFLSLIIVSLILFLSSCQPSNHEQAQSEESWIDLFDGASLTGWKIIEGEGKFYAEDGKIVGEYTLEGGNSYLVTEKNYSDFLLELEVMIDTFMNSGVQIRNNIYEKENTTQYMGGNFKISERTWTPGTAHGYQIEVDPTPRAWSGGFYEPGARGWLQTLKNNESARNAWKNGTWNHFKIQAKGNQFKTWVNGVLATDTLDNRSATGFIGFQLHTIHDPKDEGKKVQFRNIRLKEL